MPDLSPRGEGICNMIERILVGRAVAGPKRDMLVNPAQAILSAFRNYANFEGRACRSEYWWFYLLFVVLLVAIFLGSLLWTPTLLSVWVAYMVVMAPALVSVTVRRLHDLDRSGRWAILGFLPFAGGPRLTRLLAQPGTIGPNRYGPDPLRPGLGGGWVEHSVIPNPPTGPSCPVCGWERLPDAEYCADCGAEF